MTSTALGTTPQVLMLALVEPRGPDLQYLGASFRPGEWVITSRKS
jgi:hypothetical protein